MQNPNCSEAIAARQDQDDPIIMYLVVRESLGMSIGKACAQCAHGSQMLLLKYMADDKQDQTFTEWLNGSFRKVVLKADDKEWLKLKEIIHESKRVIVIDAGLTEVEPGSETIIGLWPMKKSQAPKIVKRLQVLK